MNKIKDILSQIITIARELDKTGRYDEADILTKKLASASTNMARAAGLSEWWGNVQRDVRNSTESDNGATKNAYDARMLPALKRLPAADQGIMQAEYEKLLNQYWITTDMSPQGHYGGDRWKKTVNPKIKQQLDNLVKYTENYGKTPLGNQTAIQKQTSPGAATPSPNAQALVKKPLKPVSSSKTNRSAGMLDNTQRRIRNNNDPDGGKVKDAYDARMLPTLNRLPVTERSEYQAEYEQLLNQYWITKDRLYEGHYGADRFQSSVNVQAKQQLDNLVKFVENYQTAIKNQPNQISKPSL